MDWLQGQQPSLKDSVRWLQIQSSASDLVFSFFISFSIQFTHSYHHHSTLIKILTAILGHIVSSTPTTCLCVCVTLPIKKIWFLQLLILFSYNFCMFNYSIYDNCYNLYFSLHACVSKFSTFCTIPQVLLLIKVIIQIFWKKKVPF